MSIGRVISKPHELAEGLFGGVILFLLEVLPTLERFGSRPDWHIDTRRYGNVVPTLFRPREPTTATGATRRLADLRQDSRHALGSDFGALHRLWHDRFEPSEAVRTAVEAVTLPAGRVLGVHYRGHDKQAAGWDTNPIGREGYLALCLDRLAACNDDFDGCLIAGDDEPFIELAARAMPVPVLALAAGEHHKSAEGNLQARGLDALRDCLLLSRCDAVLSTSSAMPAFAKVFRPSLDCRRCAASKWFGDVPYFPVAHLPVHRPHDPVLRAIVDRAMVGDWLQEPEASAWSGVWASRPVAEVSRKPSRSPWRRLMNRFRS